MNPKRTAFPKKSFWVGTYAVLNLLAFPGPDFGLLVLIAIVPLFLLMRESKNCKEFLQWAWCAEFLKWILWVIWLRHVSWFAVLGISLIVASYQLLWFLALYRLRNWVTGNMGWWRWIVSIAGLAILWGALEMGRNHAWGIPGATLATALWKIPTLLQVAAWIGNYGVSALIVFVNFCCYGAIVSVMDRNGQWKALLRMASVAGLLVMGVWLLLGYTVLKSFDSRQDGTEMSFRVAVVQPFQPAYRVWTPEKSVEVVETVFRLSLSAMEKEFDWMAWPEGTLPWAIHPGSAMAAEVSQLISYIGKPLIAGNASDPPEGWFNAIVIFDSDGILQETFYGKNVLVPFGEFIPLRAWLGNMETIMPFERDFDRGSGAGVLQLDSNGKKVNIGALVCYEDCFSHLGVNRSKGGADLLYVATYNVWYGEEWGAYLHAAHSVLRAVETRRPVLRCGSAGWSGFIDAQGRIRQVATDKSGSIYFRGVTLIDVTIPKHAAQSFFSKAYYWILGFQFVAGLIIFGVALHQRDTD